MSSAIQDPMALRAAMAVLAAARKSAGPQLLGNDLQAAREILRRNLLGDGFPGFWMEVPLLHTPGFDFHVSYDRPDLPAGVRFAPGAGLGHQGLVDWFANEETGGVGLGFAHDLLSGPDGGCAVYVNTNHKPLNNNAGFFGATGHPELAPAVEALLKRLPESYRVWYLGVFAQREGSPARVGCFLSDEVRLACQENPTHFECELARIGFTATSADMLQQLGELARISLQWDVQFDVFADGSVGEVLSIDLCLPLSRSTRVREFFADEALGGQAMRVLEAQAVADDRWRLVPNASFSRLAWPRATDEPYLLRCFPAFVKAKWAAGQPRAAKVYLTCTARPVASSTWDRQPGGRPSR